MKPRKIQPWEEACGVLRGLQELDGYLQLDFVSFQVVLNIDESLPIRARLEKAVGRRISILKTDLSKSGILMRNLESPTT